MHKSLSVRSYRMINLTINNRKIKAKPGTTILEAALAHNIYIPNLCYHPDLAPIGACRLCVVELKGAKSPVTACTTEVKEKMVVGTNSAKIKKLRKNILWFILSEHPLDITDSTQLKKVAKYVGIKEIPHVKTPNTRNIPIASDDPLFTRDINRCILCGRCVAICQETRKIGVLGFISRGIDARIGTNYDLSLKDSACKFCQACVEVCPSGALVDKKKFEPGDRQKVILPCTNTCPAQIDAARYVKLIAEGKIQQALEVIREKVPFPKTLGYVCDHPCEDECKRGQVNQPIAIRALKRFVSEKDSGSWRSKIKFANKTNKKVAVIGSGPAGLTAAWFLRILGHQVTVFEALEKAGGMMRSGIPAYRLPRSVLNQEIKEIERIGVKIKTKAKIESLTTLSSQGFDAVFLALGAPLGFKMGIPGEEDSRVLDGISLLNKINSRKKIDIGEKMAIVGGGNVAIDVARSALRAGVKKVTVLYRRTEKEMPALPEEVEEASKEGIKFKFLVNPQKIFAGPKKLKVECIKMKLGKPDSTGRRRPVPIVGSEFNLIADNLVIAIGQKPSLPKDLVFLLDKKGKIKADPQTAACSKKGVFAGGDDVSGPASVIEAIQAGRKGAISIDRYLGGKGDIEQKIASSQIEATRLGREEDFAYRERIQLAHLSVKERLSGFRTVEKSLSRKKAAKEAQRCLTCQLRLKISSTPLPPKKNNQK